MPSLHADGATDPARIVEMIAGKLEQRAFSGEIIDLLVAHGLTRKSAHEALQATRVGFDLALSLSMGLPIESARDAEPVVRAANDYARARIGRPGCPRFLSRSSAILTNIVVLLCIIISVGGIIWIGVNGSNELILGMGYVAAAIALLSAPFIFYLLCVYGVHKRSLGRVAQVGGALGTVLKIIRFLSH